MEEHGYTATFLTEVPEYLRCAACHLVLRDPVQILQCNHRYCFNCFEKLKCCSIQVNSQLLCPVDQRKIDISKVYKDITVEGVIHDLQVLCTFNSHGCQWKGDLGDLKSHLEQCSVGDNQDLSIPDLLKKLCKRVDCCEKGLREKDQETLLLKNSLHRRNEEVTTVKEEFEKYKEQTKKEILYLKLQITNETKLLHKKGEDCKTEMQKRNTEMDEKIKSVNEFCIDINSELKKEYRDLKLQVKGVKNLCDLNKQEFAEQKVKYDNLQNASDTINVKSNSLHNTSDSVETDIVKLQMENENNIFLSKLKSVNNQIEKLKCICDNTSTEIDSIKKNSDKLNEKVMNCMKEAVVIKGNIDKSIFQRFNEISELNRRIVNSETAFFNVTEITPQKTLFKWKLCNYAYHFYMGKRVCSPKFYSQPDSNRCQLFIQWEGFNKENLGLYFRIVKGRNDGLITKLFRMFIMLESFDKNGVRTFSTIKPTVIDSNREKCFSLIPGADGSEDGWGFRKFLFLPDLQNYVIDDSFTVTCTMIPA